MSREIPSRGRIHQFHMSEEMIVIRISRGQKLKVIVTMGNHKKDFLRLRSSLSNSWYGIDA